MMDPSEVGGSRVWDWIEMEVVVGGDERITNKEDWLVGFGSPSRWRLILYEWGDRGGRARGMGEMEMKGY